jgi:cupin fold WbuC family metalloprotein
VLSSIRPNGLREVAPGIFYGSDKLMLADRVSIEFLKQQAHASVARRARICAHLDPEAEQHDMLIVCHRNTYVAPHRHPSKSETFLIVEGEADILIFEDDGQLAARLPMGPFGSGLPFFYRMPAERYHSLDIRSEVLVFAESTQGPFRREGTESAPWAPSSQDPEAGRRYIAGLLAVAGFTRNER